jgi:predicted transcriptional regulator YdeE
MKMEPCFLLHGHTCTSHWRDALIISLKFVVVTNVESISYVGELWRERWKELTKTYDPHTNEDDKCQYDDSQVDSQVDS